MPYVANYNIERCLDCGSWRELVPCPGGGEDCIGCGACALTCPNEAIEMVEEPREGKVCIDVDGQDAFVPERISVREALQLLGYPVAAGPGEERERTERRWRREEEAARRKGEQPALFQF